MAGIAINYVKVAKDLSLNMSFEEAEVVESVLNSILLGVEIGLSVEQGESIGVIQTGLRVALNRDEVKNGN